MEQTLRSASGHPTTYFVDLFVNKCTSLYLLPEWKERNHTRLTPPPHGWAPSSPSTRIHAGFFKLHRGKIEITAAQQQHREGNWISQHVWCNPPSPLGGEEIDVFQMQYCHLSYSGGKKRKKTVRHVRPRRDYLTLLVLFQEISSIKNHLFLLFA